MKHERLSLGHDTEVHRIGDEQVSTLMVRHGASLLVECHDPGVAAAIAGLGLPPPRACACRTSP